MTIWKTTRLFKGAFLVMTISALFLAPTGEGATTPAGKTADESKQAGTLRELTLDECLGIAMENNHRRPASQFAVAMAEAQHRQALAGYWPQLNVKGAYLHTDEAPNFIFPATTVPIPAQAINAPGGMANVTIPANAFGPGCPPNTTKRATIMSPCSRSSAWWWARNF